MKYFLHLPCLLVILFSMQLRAQQIDSLHLSQAWDLAYKMHPTLTGQEALIGEYQLRKQEVKSRSLPQVQFQVQNAFGTFAGSSGAFFPVPGVFNVTGNNSRSDSAPNATGNTFGSVLMNWKVFEFGKQRTAIKGAEYQVQAAKSSYDAARIAMQAKITRLYIEVMYNHAIVNWTAAQVKRVKEIQAVTNSLTLAGLKPGADSLLASSSYAQAIAYQHEWLGKYHASKVNLSEFVPQNYMLIPQQYFMSTNDIQATADSVGLNHPYLQVLNLQVLYDQSQIRLASKKTLPTLSLLGGLSSRGSGINRDGTIGTGLGSGYHNYANNYLIGIGLSWNISGAYTSSIEKKRSTKTMQNQMAKYELQKLQMNTSLNAVYERILQQCQQVQQSNRAVSTAQSAYTLYLSRYEGGLINLTELLQIQLILQKTEKEAIEAQQNFWSLLITQSEISGDFSYLAKHFNPKP
jgi:outer membrane protein TolC